MNEYSEQKCPKCNQMLRIPNRVGGITMICPSCGNKIHSDFKFGGVKQMTRKNILVTIFEMPYRIVQIISGYFSSRS